LSRRGRRAAARPYDFDGNGFPDLAVGAPGLRVNAVSNAGGVTVLRASAAGLSLTEKIISQSSRGVLPLPERRRFRSQPGAMTLGLARAAGLAGPSQFAAKTTASSRPGLEAERGDASHGSTGLRFCRGAPPSRVLLSLGTMIGLPSHPYPSRCAEAKSAKSGTPRRPSEGSNDWMGLSVEYTVNTHPVQAEGRIGRGVARVAALGSALDLI
jgi:hypothetical protein